MTNDSQLRWVGPEKGVIHMATAAIVNAFWDLWAKLENKPVWKLLVDMSPEELVSLIDFRLTLTSKQILKRPRWKLTINSLISWKVYWRLHHQVRSHWDFECKCPFESSERTRNSKVRLSCLHNPGTAGYFFPLNSQWVPPMFLKVGWLGYPDEKIRSLAKEFLAKGFTSFKIKVGSDINDDIRRLRCN